MSETTQAVLAISALWIMGAICTLIMHKISKKTGQNFIGYLVYVIFICVILTIFFNKSDIEEDNSSKKFCCSLVVQLRYRVI